jgi:cytidylate kinase
VTVRVVAIDGAAGSGKSTLARLLARELRLPYVNTGSMYRALTLAARRGAVDVEDGRALARLMANLEFTLSSGPEGELLIDGARPSDDLETEDVEAYVSTVAKHSAVRSAMRAAQRSLGEEGGAVMEGRDIGTVVFADAPLKLFLVAEPGERAGRRVDERGGMDLAEALHERDRLDAAVNPHVPADDAVVIDTSQLSVEGTLHAALEAVARRAPELLPPDGRRAEEEGSGP